ncbi:MAG TPA: hypothetical protein VFG07_09005 [Thermoplasmata archaeon]|nr:hypothetical protein [Thermoplasmata archaeon]
MPSSIIESATPEQPSPTGPRLRTVTGNRWPRKCSCGCNQPIPRDPEIRYVVDFGAPRPYPVYLREHSPDFGSYRAGASARPRVKLAEVSGFTPASELPRRPDAAPEIAHADEDASPSPEAGRAWASGQLVFNAGSFESARSGFASYAANGETESQLRARVNRVILEDLEQKVLALRALHEKLRDRLGAPDLRVRRAHGNTQARE